MKDLVSAFEKQVSLFPDKKLIITRENSYTYNEINDKANSFAHVIIDECSRISDVAVVAVLFNKEPLGIAALLSVLKAKKTYIPLEVKHPPNILANMMEQTNARIIITSTEFFDLANEIKIRLSNRPIIINIDTINENTPKCNPIIPVSENRNGYIIFTSGSSGKPKGVAQTHKNILFYVESYIKYLNISANDKLTYVTSSGHDGAVMDIFSALLSGATLYPIDIKSIKNPIDFFDWIDEEKITVWHSVPTVIKYIYNSIEVKRQFKHIRLIVFGGEPVLANHIEIAGTLFNNAEIYNLYGQTESSFSTGGWCTSENGAVISIGKPIKDIHVFIVNEEGQQVNDYEIGELIIGGPNISNGYWNDVKASNKFQEDQEFGMLFWTGDLALSLPDGQIKLVGRKDNQIKIRGNRVELEGVDEIILQSGNVEHAVSIAYDNNGEDTLCSFVVLKPSGTKEKIMDYLAKNLPDYMIPAHVTVLKEMPLTASGKINRKAMPLPFMVISNKRVESFTNKQIQIRDIWTEVLGIDVNLISVDESFFKLGGHSLKAMRLAAKIYSKFGISVSLVDIFKYETIAKQVEYIEQIRKGAISSDQTEEEESTPSLFQQQIYNSQIQDLQNTEFNEAIFIELNDATKSDKINLIFKKLINRHNSFRTYFVSGGKAILRKNLLEEFKVETVKKAVFNKKDLMSELIKPFDLSLLPLVRVYHIQVADSKDYLFIDVHSIVKQQVANEVSAMQLLGSEYQYNNAETLFIDYMHYSITANVLVV